MAHLEISRNMQDCICETTDNSKGYRSLPSSLGALLRLEHFDSETQKISSNSTRVRVLK